MVITHAFAAAYLREFTKANQSARIVGVGSYRRGRETLKDLDILVDTICPVIPGLIEKKSAGSLRIISIVKYRGKKFQLDIFYGDPKCWAFALLHHTGGKTENISMRAHAKRLGYKLSQYGLFKGDKPIPGLNTERKIYKALGKTYKAPADRTD